MSDGTDKVDPSFFDIFGPQKLLKGEEKAKYNKLRKAFFEILRPKNLLDEIQAREIVNTVWLSQRYQQLSPALVNAKWGAALRHLADSNFGYVTEEAEEWFDSLEGKPYPDGMTEADVLKKLGLSPELVQAQAVLFAVKESAVLDALSESQIAARNSHLKDYERRKLLETKKKRAAEKAKLQTGNRANDNRPPDRGSRRSTSNS